MLITINCSSVQAPAPGFEKDQSDNAGQQLSVQQTERRRRHFETVQIWRLVHPDAVG